MGTVSTNSTYTFTVTGSRSLTAVFEAVIPTYTITAAIDPPGAGTVTGAGQYQQGEPVTLTAAINDGYSFTGWQENGETVSTDNPYTFTAAGDRAFTAAFAEKPASRLPAGYTEVEYISNPNLGYIQDAGIPTEIFKHIIDLYADLSETTQPGYIMGTSSDSRNRMGSSSSNYKYFASQRVSDVKWLPLTTKVEYYLKDYSYGYSSYKPTASELAIKTYSLQVEPQGKKLIQIDYPQNKFRVNEQEVITSSFTSSINSTLSFGIFAINTYYKDYTGTGSYTYGYSPCNYKFYSMQITEKETGTVVNDFVPCVNEEGLAGLYDLVKEVFYSSSVAEKPFTAGPEI